MKPNPVPPTLEEFLACCRSECDFLVTEYGFERLDAPREYNEFSVRFRKGELEVDVYGEGWGQYASCDLLRGADELSLGLLIPAEVRRAPGPKRPAVGQLAQVRRIAEILQRYAADFLHGDTRRFDIALAEWKRITTHRPLSDEAKAERERASAVTAAGHASRRAKYAEVVRLLEPYAAELSRHQRRLLLDARAHLEGRES